MMESWLKPEALLSAISVAIAVIVYKSSRKSFMLEIANRRSDKVNDLFKETSKDMSVAKKEDKHYLKFWTVIISELVISINIIESLSGKNWFTKLFTDYDDVCYVFWEQLNTAVRTHFETYDEAYIDNIGEEDKKEQTRKAQLKTIIDFQQKIKYRK